MKSSFHLPSPIYTKRCRLSILYLVAHSSQFLTRSLFFLPFSRHQDSIKTWLSQRYKPSAKSIFKRFSYKLYQGCAHLKFYDTFYFGIPLFKFKNQYKLITEVMTGAVDLQNNVSRHQLLAPGAAGQGPSILTRVCCPGIASE